MALGPRLSLPYVIGEAHLTAKREFRVNIQRWQINRERRDREEFRSTKQSTNTITKNHPTHSYNNTISNVKLEKVFS